MRYSSISPLNTGDFSLFVFTKDLGFDGFLKVALTDNSHVLRSYISQETVLSMEENKEESITLTYSVPEDITFGPRNIEVFYSPDGKNFRPLRNLQKDLVCQPIVAKRLLNNNIQILDGNSIATGPTVLVVDDDGNILSKASNNLSTPTPGEYNVSLTLRTPSIYKDMNVKIFVAFINRTGEFPDADFLIPVLMDGSVINPVSVQLYTWNRYDYFRLTKSIETKKQYLIQTKNSNFHLQLH